MRRLAAGDHLVIATHNPGKRHEIAALLAPWRLTLSTTADHDLLEPEETADDFSGNAALKALAASRATGLPALADDSGFCVAALGGAPGVLSARWAGPAKDFAGAMARVHAEAAASADRRAWFVCVLCLAWPDGATSTFQGRVDGAWVYPPRGGNGFGYDPMFVPAGSRATYGEMPHGEKEADSHRGRAFAQLVAACFTPPGSDRPC